MPLWFDVFFLKGTATGKGKKEAEDRPILAFLSA